MVVLGFLYLPILVMAVMSFNDSEFYRLPVDWSWRWYGALADNSKFAAAATNSVVIATITAVVATVLGTAAAVGLHRYEFRGKRALRILLLPPIAIPWLIVGTAMLIFFFLTGIGRGLHAILLGHVALALPYVIVVVSARVASFDRNLEDAARSLGASPGQVVWRVIIPQLAPGIVAGALFAFAVSFDQFVVSHFLSKPGATTLPVEIYTSIRKGFTPEVNAVSTIIIVVSMLLLIGVARFYRFSEAR